MQRRTWIGKTLRVAETGMERSEMERSHQLCFSGGGAVIQAELSRAHALMRSEGAVKFGDQNSTFQMSIRSFPTGHSHRFLETETVETVDSLTATTDNPTEATEKRSKLTNVPPLFKTEPLESRDNTNDPQGAQLCLFTFSALASRSGKQCSPVTLVHDWTDKCMVQQSFNYKRMRSIYRI